MKKNLFTTAAVVAAAISMAPAITTSLATSADTTGDISQLFQAGTVLINPNGAAPLYDYLGNITGKKVDAGTNAYYSGIYTWNGQTYYHLITGGYVAAADVLIIRAEPTNDKTVTVNQNGAVVSDVTAANKGGKATTLAANTSWQVMGKYSVNGLEYYQIGAKQYVKASDVRVAKTAAQKNAVTPSTSYRAVGTVNYVPGYGIQVWTKSHQFVTNTDGSLKKLQDGTNWKIFGESNLNGKTYYNLGGDQWLDANYISLK